LLKELLIAQIQPTIDDFKNNIFLVYNERITGTGFHLKLIQDALEWNNFHEGPHLGYMMTIEKAYLNQYLLIPSLIIYS